MTEVSNAGEVDASTGGENEGGGNEESSKWLNSAPDEYKNNKILGGYQKFGDALKDLVAFKSDGNIVRIPEENASDEDRAAFYTKLGRPDKPEGYNIAKPENLPEDIPYTPEGEKVFKDLAHGLNLSQEQASKLHSFYWDFRKNELANTAKAKDAIVEESINKLKDEWKGDEYETNKNIAVRAFEELTKEIDPDKTLLNEKLIGQNILLGNHPAFLKLFHKIGLEVLDDSAAGDKGVGGSVDADSDEAKAERMYPKMKK